jgi:hypothetical protein
VQKFLQNYKKSHVLSPNGDLATKNNNVNKPLPPLPSLPSAEETTTPGSTKLFQTLRHAFDRNALIVVAIAVILLEAFCVL